MRFIILLSAIVLSGHNYSKAMTDDSRRVVIKNLDKKREIGVKLWWVFNAKQIHAQYTVAQNSELAITIPNVLKNVNISFRSENLYLRDSVHPTHHWQEFHLAP